MASHCLFVKLVQYRFLQVYSYKNLQQARACHHNVSLGQSQQGCLRGLVGHVHDDASICAGEGRREEQRIRDVLFRRRRRRRHSGDDGARQRSLHGRHVERVEQLNGIVRDRVHEFFRALPSAFEQVDRPAPRA